MNVLLVTALGADEIHAWRGCLAAAAPSHRWSVDGDPGVDPGEVDVAVVAQPPAGRLARLPRLRLVQSLWAGVDRLLVDPTLPAGVPIARMVEPHMTAAMVETALWAVLSLHRGFFAYAAQQRAGRWAALPQRRAGDVAVLVLGRGAMGGAVAGALRERGYAVRTWHRGEPLQPEGAQVVVNLLPLTADTSGLLDARFFARLAEGAGVVNLARGAHVVEADLLAALDAGRVGHAVLDVFQEEPLAASHPFWTHPKVTVLPHAAALTDRAGAAQVVARNLEALEAGRPLAHLVDRARGY